MELYLSGGGSGEALYNIQREYFEKLDKSKSILYIPLAMEESKYDSCKEWFIKEMKIYNISKIEMITSAQKLSQKNLELYNSIYIGGGNTYKLLHELYKYNCFEKIRKYLYNGGKVYGGSAGAIIFGKNIDTCKLDDQTQIEYTEREGMNLIEDYSLLCHLNEKNYKRNIDYLKEYSKIHKTIYLSEDSAIYINRDNIILYNENNSIIVDNMDIKRMKML